MSEQVNHPAHYNNHPSNVEAIEVIESMYFNIGNAFKYIYRRNDKENLEQDIKKAIWYLDAEINRRSKWGYTSISRLLQPLYFFARQDIYTTLQHRDILIKRIVEVEPNYDIAVFYTLAHRADKEYWTIEHLKRAKHQLQIFLAKV